MTVPDAKAELRRTLRARFKTLTAAERAAGSAEICEQVQAQDFWQAAKAVLLYAPMPDEVDIWPLVTVALRQGKLVALPRFDAMANRYVTAQVLDLERDLVAGAFGIREPAAHCPEITRMNIDLALVPGLAFDTTGRRLGRGKGFYDRLLADFNGVKCGVAQAEQMVEEVPVEGHDVRVKVVVTPARI